MNKLKSVKPNTNTGKHPQKATFLGMSVTSFTVVALVFLGGMTVEYPFVRFYLFYPIVYDLVKYFSIPSEFPVMVVEMIWFFPLFWFEYWFLGKRRRMLEAKAELKRQQKESHTPQP